VIRALFYLIFAVILISVLRSVIGFIASMFTDAAVGPERRAATPQAEALKRDPVCGTFVAPSTAMRKDKDGQTYFFCSQACRDKF
jgi:hypothetical protein